MEEEFYDFAYDHFQMIKRKTLVWSSAKSRFVAREKQFHFEKIGPSPTSALTTPTSVAATPEAVAGSDDRKSLPEAGAGVASWAAAKVERKRAPSSSLVRRRRGGN